MQSEINVASDIFQNEKYDDNYCGYKTCGEVYGLFDQLYTNIERSNAFDIDFYNLESPIYNTLKTILTFKPENYDATTNMDQVVPAENDYATASNVVDRTYMITGTLNLFYEKLMNEIGEDQDFAIYNFFN